MYKENLGNDLSSNDEKRFIERLAYEGVAAGTVQNLSADSGSEDFQVVARLINCIVGMPLSFVDKINAVLHEAGMTFEIIKSLLRHNGWQITHVETVGFREGMAYKIKAYKQKGSVPKEEHYRIKISTPKPAIEGLTTFKTVNVEIEKKTHKKEIRTVRNLEESNIKPLLDSPGEIFIKR